MSAEELEPVGAPISINILALVEGLRRNVRDFAEGKYVLAEKVGVTAPTLYEFAAGKRVPTIYTLQALCDFFMPTLNLEQYLGRIAPPVSSFPCGQTQIVEWSGVNEDGTTDGKSETKILYVKNN
ncbi:helix-turn-helix domain-containing protein [Neorhizobium galegae]|uniref:helix-turn-helix domain-containing protein n=1 Tax=Neorhizobium galegae TaxID=399 RepID=UPI0006218B1D|nr:helix-turn-helix transcriptional regulator [Neorhizobium galegae]KAB1126309.1 helix-turn-helix transcriptional regulator [Neorhizobium galegae]MCQ1805281.1 helix-turn-helix domain-containing protein [Neorhizobium galegae]CDZ56042.1 Hypothetical protein NGAL_HAMBI2566_05920 [Neorhizobium galegae bv. orientalis]